MKQGHLSNEEAQKRLRGREKEHRRRADADLQAVLATPIGRRFVWRVLSHMSGAFGISFTGTTNQSFFNEGRRSVGVDLMTEAQRVSPADYVHMLNEQLRATQEDALHKKQAEGTPETE